MPQQTPSPPAARPAPVFPAEPRRGFFAKLAALVLGLLLYVPAALAGLWTLIDPLRKEGQKGRFVKLTALDALPSDGTPQKFPIIADHMDAWTHYAQEPVGAVFLRRVGATVEAFQAVCPHAGCQVGFEAQKKVFFCPCHSASFALDGKRAEAKSQSPRDLDALTVEIRSGGEVWVKFEKFRIGIPQKVVEA